MRDKIETALTETALKILREYKKGCLFIIKEGTLDYELQMVNDFKKFNIFNGGRRLEPLALQSGACIIDLEGNLIAYGAKILNTKVYPNYGTRHGAAYTASLSNNTSILASDDDLKVRIFKGGKMAMQIDPLERNVNVIEAVNVLESIGVGTVGTLGVTTLIPNLLPGLQIIPGVIIFGSTYLLAKLLMKKK
jgi:hypothetical protein